MTVEDLLKVTGISTSSFWFEFFFNMFIDSCREIDTYTELVKYIEKKNNNKKAAILVLGKYEIDGLTFFDKKVLHFKTDNKYFEHVSFKLLRSKKIKAIGEDEFNE